VRKADLQHSKASGVTWRVWRPQPYKGKVAEGVCREWRESDAGLGTSGVA
jgi:hypothetical protein